MKQPLTHALPAKVIGIFLLVILFLLIALSGACTLGSLYYGIYDRGVTSYYDTNDCRSEILSDLHSIYYMMNDGVTDLSDHWYYGDFTECNLRFAGYSFSAGQYLSNDGEMLLAMQQIVLSAHLEQGEVQPQYSPDQHLLIEIGPDATPEVALSEDGRKLGIVLQWDSNDTYFIAGVVTPLPARDAYFRQHRLFDLAFDFRLTAPVLLIVSLFAAIADLIFLCCAAGHRRGREDILPNLQDRIPLDLYLGAAGLSGVGLLVLISELLVYDDLIRLLAALGLSILLLLLALATLLTLCTRFKLGKWWCNTIIWRCGRLVIRLFRTVGRGFKACFRLLPLVWRSILILCVLLAAQTFLTLLMFDSGDPGEWFLVTIVFDIALLLVTMWVARQLQLLRAAGAALAVGNYDQKIDLTHMCGSLREHGEHLNSLGQGLSMAVEQKMRSERMKTELITNVSHDIKTPLTSIVNYVDLLQKDPSEEERTEYLTVLDRQAKRLKKLTEDLVEASKASTGNLTVNLVPTNLREIIDQAIGEYEDRLKAVGLSTVVAMAEDELYAIADGRLLWRVLDNLLNNACKYAMGGTRVYLEVKTEGNRAVLSMKNISRQQLNLSPDELMERFVRGDSSRNTEGSGLGLNIARSLVELQAGTFDLSIDGDLFKAIISLPRYSQSSAQMTR